MTFNPAQPTVKNSLNRVVIVDLPGYPLPDEVKGQRGYSLLSSQALTGYIRENSHALELDATLDDTTLRMQFVERLNADYPAALSIAQRMGRNLGYLLLALHRGDAVNRAARDEWDSSYWDYWATIRTVHLGGGLVMGTMGAIIVENARAILNEIVPDYSINVATYPRYLPLIGAARLVAADDCTAVFDFGSTFIKRAIATYNEQGLQRMELQPPVEVGFSQNVTQADAPAIVERLVEIIASTCADISGNVIPVSLAAYVDERGQPLLTQGGLYMQMNYLSDDVQGMLAEKVSQRLGRRMQLHLVHDCTAAAMVYAGEANAAIIMLGTALGAGFPVVRPYLRLISAALSIIDARA